GAEPGHQEMLDENGSLRQLDAVDHALRSGLDHRQTALAPPLFEPEPARPKQRLLPVAADPPPHVALLPPVPGRGLEQAVGRAQPDDRSEPPAQPLMPAPRTPACRV